eukprot:TRINITY_DN11389_c0_g1_i1.p1 TRINITY_DN11389_c0_g1~~TRINITY_DN11389_c0_g1_i1.p1  ORF type:complete len:360 (-),score=97.03 TRINITY_DN11389_c0_g1_i1:15-1061(-)
MKQAVLLFLLGSILCCFGDFTVQLPAGYVSEHTFHYGGNIYAVLDADNTTTLNPKLGMISNGQWGQIIDLPNVCTEAPCLTHTDDVLVQHNVAYISCGSFDFTKTIISVDLQSFSVVGSTTSPAGHEIEDAYFLPAEDGYAYYFYLEVFFDQYFVGELYLPTLEWTNPDLGFDLYHSHMILPYDADTLISCGDDICHSINTQNNQDYKFYVDLHNCMIPNYLPPSQLLFCTEFDSNQTIIASYNVQTTSITQNLTIPIPGDNFPSFSAINAQTNIAYVLTNLSNNTNILYEVDLGLFQVIKSTTLNIDPNYGVFSHTSILPTEGDGLLALPLISINGTLPAEILFVSV